MIRFGLHLIGFDSLKQIAKEFDSDSDSEWDADPLDSIRFGFDSFGIRFLPSKIRFGLRFGFGSDSVWIWFVCGSV